MNETDKTYCTTHTTCISNIWLALVHTDDTPCLFGCFSRAAASIFFRPFGGLLLLYTLSNNLRNSLLLLFAAWCFTVSPTTLEPTFCCCCFTIQAFTMLGLGGLSLHHGCNSSCLPDVGSGCHFGLLAAWGGKSGLAVKYPSSPTLPYINFFIFSPNLKHISNLTRLWKYFQN